MDTVSCQVAAHAEAKSCAEAVLKSLECAVFVPGGGRPIWQVVLAEAGKMNGGVLAPGRLYVTNADGVLCAIGDQ